MSQELIYTSAPKGLKPGTRGFCTVVSTQQMSAPLAERLESLSGYRHLFPPNDVQAHFNPVIYSHLILPIGGRKHHVLSRIADAGLDYTQRSNKFVHHVVLDAAELPRGGPAWLLMQPGFMQSNWDGEPKLLSTGRRAPDGFAPPAACRQWQALTGDAGWAGALAETATGPSLRPACLLFRPGQNLLPLVAEALALLPIEQRWQVTFSTWFTKLPPGVECQWRFLLAGSPEAKAALRQPHALVLDLTSPQPNAGASAMVIAARTGVLMATAKAADHAPIAARPLPQAKEESIAGVRGASMPVSASEYSVGPPPLTGGDQPVLPSGLKKRQPKRNLTVVISLFAVLLVVAASATAIGVVALRNKRTQSTPIAARPKQAEIATLKSAAKGSKANESNSESIASESGAPPAPGVPPQTLKNKQDADEVTASQVNSTREGPNGNGTPAEPEKPSQAQPETMESIANQNAKQPPDSAPKPNIATAHPGPSPEAPGSETTPGGPPKNAFAELIRKGGPMELPPTHSSEAELKLLSNVDPNAVRLELIGWRQLTGRDLDYRKNAEGTNPVWNITEKFEETVLAQPAPFAVFSLRDERLIFKWLKVTPGSSAPAALRNCLLKLTLDDQEPVITALRKSAIVDLSSVTFQTSSSKLPIPLNDQSGDIQEKLVRLEFTLIDTEDDLKCVRKPASGRAKLDSDVRAEVPFNSQSAIVIKARLTKDAEFPLVIRFTYRWLHQVFDPTKRIISPKEDALSIPAVEKALEELKRSAAGRLWAGPLKEAETNLAKVQEDFKKAQEEVEKHKKKDNANKEEQERLQKKAERLGGMVTIAQSKIDALKAQREYFNAEPGQCERLLQILEDLPARIRLRVYYELGDGDDDAMQVRLAETKDN